MDKKLFSLLACPSCKSHLKLTSNKLICTSCKKEYPLKEGIPCFI